MSETESKSAPASKRKLAKKREEGAVATASELAGLFGVAVGLTFLAAFGVPIWTLLVNGFAGSIPLIGEPFLEALPPGVHQLTWTLVKAVVPIFALCVAAAVISTIIYNNGIVFSIKPVTPQFERISPKAGFKRIYGRRGWVESTTGLVRLLLWFVVAGVISVLWLPQLMRTFACLAPCQANIIVPMVWYFLIAAIVIFLIASAVDMIMQKQIFMHEQRMTKTEVKREQKEQFGTPEIRRERRRMQREMSAGADSIGVGRANMCFFWKDQAIAIRFLPPKSPLPRIAAKAKGATAVKTLRDTVRKNGCPETESEVIVANGIDIEIGGVLDRAAYTQFGTALRDMFGGIPNSE